LAASLDWTVRAGQSITCLITIRHRDQDYFGTLSFDDEEFFKKICGILNGHIGEPTSAIGGLDIPED
jgi:hypothetical protein